MPVTSISLPGGPCLDALAGALAEVRGGDPLAPATVLVPGTVAALHVRRALGLRGGVAAVDVVTTTRLAERLGRPGLAAAGLSPLPPGGWEEAVRLALAADPGPFRAVAHHPATVARVAGALRRLRPATAAEREAMGGRSAAGRRGRHLVRLLAAVEGATPRHHDGAALVVAACQALGAGVDPGPVVAFCPPGTEPIEVELLALLAAAGRLRVVVAATGDTTADGPVRRLVERLDGPAAWDPPVAARPAPAHLVLAPDADAEARLVVQRVVAALERGVPGHAIAVLSLGGATGLGRLADLLDAAQVPWSGPLGTTLAASPSGRVLLGLLGLDAEGWSHSGVLAVLAGAPLRRSPSRPETLPLGRWAALTRQANVVGGPDQWRERPLLAAGAARRRGQDGLAAELEELAGFAAELHGLLDPPATRTWAALSAWALGLLDHVLDPAAAVWPEAQVVAHRAVRAAVAGLAVLDGVSGAAAGTGSAPTPTDLLDTLAARLGSTAAPRRGRVGHGVLVADDAEDLIGATPQALFLVGVVEGAAPARRSDDPLVPDAELELITATPSRGARRAAAHASVLQAVASSGAAVASAHRADAQSARRPSRWFLGWAGTLAGGDGASDAAPMGADDLEATQAPWLTVVPSFAATACGPVAASDQERRLGDLAAAARSGADATALSASAAVREHAALGLAMRAAWARHSDRFTAWDGQVAPGLALDEEVSASALEDWAACPQRYLLAHVLGVGATEAPGDALAVDGRDRGSVAHEVLAAVVRRGLGRHPSEPWGDADRAFLGAEVQRRAEALRTAGRLGRGVLADLRIDELHASLLATLDLDDADRASDGWVPDQVEWSFGQRAGHPVAVSLPSGRTVRFRGRVDRLDVGEDDRVRVVDYKTGRGTKYREEAAGGAAAARLLQLGVYEAAASASRPGARVSSGWWLVEAVGRDGRPVGIVANRLGPDDFSAAVDAIATGIEGGAFPADPGEDGYRGPENCRFCAFDRVCRVDRVRALRRKADQPALAPWRALRAVGLAVADDEAAAGGAPGGPAT